MQLWQTTRDATSQRLTTPQVVPFLLEARLKEVGASNTTADYLELTATHR